MPGGIGAGRLIGADDVRAVWEGLDVDRRRAVIDASMSTPMDRVAYLIIWLYCSAMMSHRVESGRSEQRCASHGVRSGNLSNV
jgi:hypothetical protein